MAAEKLTARLLVSDRTFSATFDESGHLRVLEGTNVVYALNPPDSWLAIAVVARSSHNQWGTRPSIADLEAYLEQYVSGPAGQ